MIGEWVAQGGPLLLALVVVFVPGLAIGTIVGLRGLALVATAPVVSVALVSLLAMAYSWLGIHWDAMTVGALVAVLLLVAIVVAVRARRRRVDRPPVDLGRRGLLIAALVVGGGLTAARLMAYIGAPAAISQTNDAVFHLNALRWIAESGTASSLHVTDMLGVSSFYPAAWHAVASLIVTDPALIPVAVNMLTLVIGAVVWPLGIALAARVAGLGDHLVTVGAAALSGTLFVFPQLMFTWGVLYPYALSLALVPATVAAIMGVIDRRTAGVGPRASAIVVAVAGLAAVSLAQPSSLLLVGLIVLCWATGLAFASRAAASSRRLGLVVGALVAAWAALIAVWAVLAYLAGPVLWRSYRSIPEAMLDVLLNGHSQVPPALLTSLFMVVGIVWAARAPRARWVLVAWGLLSLLYVLSVATDLPVVKRLLTGPWYGDSFRLAAAVAPVVVLLAAFGFAASVRLLARLGMPSRIARASVLGVIALVGAVSIAVTPVVLMRVAEQTDRESRYALSSSSYLSADEYRLLQRLPELIPADALVIGNPSTGAAFGYGISGRHFVVRTWAPPQSDAWTTLARGLRNAADDPAVCPALEAYGSPDYVLDFGPGSRGPGLHVMRGMTGFDGKAGFELVAEEGDVSLWRITACG